MVWWAACSRFRTPPSVSSPKSGGVSTSRQRVDFKISTLVHRSLTGAAPVYLADECTLVTAAGRRPLRSTCLAIHAPVRWPLFCHRQANAVEQYACWTASATGYHLRTIKTMVENVLVSSAAAPCVWTLRVLTRNLLTYLLTHVVRIDELRFDEDLKVRRNQKC